jgi:hypothetical protein
LVGIVNVEAVVDEVEEEELLMLADLLLNVFKPDETAAALDTDGNVTIVVGFDTDLKFMALL